MVKERIYMAFITSALLFSLSSNLYDTELLEKYKPWVIKRRYSTIKIFLAENVKFFIIFISIIVIGTGIERWFKHIDKYEIASNVDFVMKILAVNTLVILIIRAIFLKPA